VFKGQEWLTDLIMWGMVKKGIVEWRKYWEKEGRGRKPYVFVLKVESDALPKAVGAEAYVPNWLNSRKTVDGTEEEKTLNNNSSSLEEEQRSGLVEVGKGERFPERRGKVKVVAKIEKLKESEKVLNDLKKELKWFLKRYSMLQFDFQKRAEVLKGAVKGRLRMGTLMELWDRDKELYGKLWSLLELFRIIELPQQDAVMLVVPKDVADFVKKVHKVYLGGKLNDEFRD
jgi:hypothetical protein